MLRPVNIVVVPKDLLVQAGGFEENAPFHSHEDHDLWLRLALAGSCFNEPVPQGGSASSPRSSRSLQHRSLRVPGRALSLSVRSE